MASRTSPSAFSSVLPASRTITAISRTRLRS